VTAGAQVDPECRVSSAHTDAHACVGKAGGASCLSRGNSTMLESQQIKKNNLVLWISTGIKYDTDPDPTICTDLALKGQLKRFLNFLKYLNVFLYQENPALKLKSFVLIETFWRLKKLTKSFIIYYFLTF